MNKGFVFAVAVLMVAIGGCGRPQQQVQKLGSSPALESVSLRDSHIEQALKAAGGLDKWVKTRQISLNAVVSLYKDDGSFYLTRQHYDVYPWSQAVRIIGGEPTGRYKWLLRDEDFELSGDVQGQQGSDKSEKRPYVAADLLFGLAPSEFAQSLLLVMTAPAHLLGRQMNVAAEKADLHRQPKVVRLQWSGPVKVAGRMYYRTSLTRTDTAQGKMVSVTGIRRVVFYQNAETDFLDRIWFVGDGSGTSFAVWGYDYRELEMSGIYVPSKINVYKTNLKGIPQEQIVGITIVSEI